MTHLGALWRVLFVAFRKQYMGFGRGLRIGAGDRKEERRVYGAWNKLTESQGQRKWTKGWDQEGKRGTVHGAWDQR